MTSDDDVADHLAQETERKRAAHLIEMQQRKRLVQALVMSGAAPALQPIAGIPPTTNLG